MTGCFSPEKTAPSQIRSRKDWGILLVDDHALVRFGLRGFLELYGWHVLGEAADLATARSLAAAHQPKILLLDLSLGSENGLDLLRPPAPWSGPPPRVILFSMFLTAETVDEAQALGVTGFITKSAPLEHLLAALRAVTAEKTYLSPDIRSRLKARQSPRKRLPPREEEVFQLLGQGFRLTEIAGQLALSVKTVDTYVGRLCRNLGFDSRKALIRHAIERHQKRF